MQTPFLSPRSVLLAALFPALAALATQSAPQQVPSDMQSVRSATTPELQGATLRLYSNFPIIPHNQIAQASTDIVHARVQSVTPFEFRPGWISRRVVLEVANSWRGEATGTKEVIIHGGQLGYNTTVDDSAPELFVGEEIVAYIQEVGGEAGAIFTAGDQSSHMVVADEDGRRHVMLGQELLPLEDLILRDRVAIEAQGGKTK